MKEEKKKLVIFSKVIWDKIQRIKKEKGYTSDMSVIVQAIIQFQENEKQN
jgi:hypothetical protein